MKILIFAELYYPDIMGGGEFSTKQMTEGLAGKGHEVVVYCLGGDTREEEINGVRVKRRYIRGASEHFLSLAKNNPAAETFIRPEKNNPAAESLTLKKKNDLAADSFIRSEKIRRKWGDFYPCRKWYEYYRSIMVKEAPDAVHTASPMSYLGRFNLWKAAYDLKLPVSHVCRAPNLLVLDFLGGMLDGYNRRRNAKSSSYLTALAAPSRYMLDIHNRAGIRGQNFNEVIYNAVDFDPVYPTQELIARKENVILYAGELSEKKGIHTLIQAVEGIEGAELLLIGSPELKARIKQSPKVKVYGWMEREAIYAYMQKAKAVVLASKWDEPFGRILIEAPANGTIAIGSDRGAIPEVLGHREAYIFKSGDAAGLRRRIERVIHMSPLQYKDEVKKQQKAMSRFTGRSYADNWERFFLKQLG